LFVIKPLARHVVMHRRSMLYIIFFEKLDLF